MIDQSRSKLVVIDDDPDVLRATARILVQAGYQVITGVNAAEALELTRHHLPDLLLLDVILPDGSGVDVARQLKREPALARVHIILLSGLKTSGEDQAAGLATGLADGYISRPFSKVEFLARVDAMLRLSEERYRLLAENATDVIWVLDAETQTFRYMSPAVESMLGFTSEEFVNRSVAQTVTPASFAFIQEASPTRIERTLQGHTGSYLDEIELVHKDGHIVVTEINMRFIVNKTTGLIEGIGVMRDITERKNFEAELEQHRHHLEELVLARTAELAQSRDAANAANRAKSAFLANMSHELRTPLNAILGLGHIVAAKLVEPGLRAQVETITRAGRQLLEMVDQVLEMSALETDELALETTDFDLPATLAEALGALRERAEARGLVLAHEIDPALPRSLHGDVRKLGRILTTLSGNAVKFSEHGRVTLRAQLIDSNDDALRVRFEVKDQGVGIGAEQQATMFSTFEQVDNSITRQHGGLGLGLALCKRLAQQLGGEIGVSSTPGQGSTFWLAVPLTRAIESAHAETHPETEPAKVLPDVSAAVPKPAPIPPADPARVRALLEQLDSLLAKSDTAAIGLYEEHAEALRAALGAASERLGREIHQFAFEAAREILHDFLTLERKHE